MAISDRGFASMDSEKQKAIARKGGQASGKKSAGTKLSKKSTGRSNKSPNSSI